LSVIDGLMVRAQPGQAGLRQPFHCSPIDGGYRISHADGRIGARISRINAFFGSGRAPASERSIHQICAQESA